MYRLILCVVIVWLPMSESEKGYPQFDDYFLNKNLRIDFLHGSSKNKEEVFLDKLYEEPNYSGSKKRFVDDRNLGQYCYELYTRDNGTLIFRNHYASLFREWQTTDEAGSGASRVFLESVNVPFPKAPVRFVLKSRGPANNLGEIFALEIDPSSSQIVTEQKYSEFKTGEVLINGVPAECVDILFLAEGYDQSEMKKFRKDVERFTEVMFSADPYKEYQSAFNIRFIESPSEESGVDDPGKGISRRSLFNSTYNTFGYDRYLTTFDYKTIKDVASNTYYDQIILLVNSRKYGGAGFYNFYSIFCSDIPFFDRVFIHELGHTFANLADEYDGDFTDFYRKDVEPVEVNITIQTDRSVLKWKHLVSLNTPIPTPPDEVFRDSVGLFEGAGYSTTGIYRPQLDCRMRSNTADGYCAVCREAIVDAIRYYTNSKTE